MTANSKYFYHITTEDAAKKILKEGLKPSIGESSNLVNEDRKAVYLCKHKDVPYWEILLGKFVVLKINDIKIDNDDIYQYYLYDEYLYHEEISPEKIKRVYFKKPSNEKMRNLCLSYIDTVNHTLEVVMRYYYDKAHYEVDEEYVDTLLSSCIAALNNLDYSVLTKKEIRDYVKDCGDNGAYTFDDEYFETGKRLYQQLVLFPADSLEKKRKELYKLIKKDFKGCFSIDTGGWTAYL